MKDKIGKVGEDLAVMYLKRMGYRIVERNFRTPFGEIDIIAKDGDTLVFVEVKRRISPLDPLEAITPLKIRQITKVAHLYLKARGKKEPECRFDVVAVHDKKVKLIKDAFLTKG
jgi:putative endonuclease